MLARKLISVGRMRCPRPCRARNATLRPSRAPSTYASEGSPNGVCTVTSRTSVSPGMEYRPLPPIMPISACCKESLLQNGVSVIITEAVDRLLLRTLVQVFHSCLHQLLREVLIKALDRDNSVPCLLNEDRPIGA